MTDRLDLHAVSTDRAGYPDLLEVFSWLDRDPVLNVYPAALVLRDGLSSARDEYWLARRAPPAGRAPAAGGGSGALVGLLVLGGASGAVLPLGDDPAALEALALRAAGRLAALPPHFQVVGQRAAVATVVERLRAAGLEPRLHRPQTYMSLERGGLPRVEGLPQLRPARPDDFRIVHDSGAELRAEELQEDPRRVDPGGYARRVVEECRDGYTYVWIEDGALRFRASLSALTADAVQIAGVFTPPAWRNQGFARRGVAELCRRLFERTRAACLFVNDSNAPAIAVYRRLGFRDHAEWGSAFYTRPRATP